LITIAFACLLGLLAFAGIMVTAEPHHGEHGGPSAHDTAPTGTEKGAPPESHNAPDTVPSNEQTSGSH
jgi:hypothetical protein